MRLVIASAAVAAAKPLTHDFFGYEFDVGPMIVALAACLVVRLYYTSKATTPEAKSTVWAITVLTLLVTAGYVMNFRPAPLYAIGAGTGIGAIGAGLIRIAERKMRRLFDDDEPEVIDDDEGIRRASEQIKELP